MLRVRDAAPQARTQKGSECWLRLLQELPASSAPTLVVDLIAGVGDVLSGVVGFACQRSARAADSKIYYLGLEFREHSFGRERWKMR